MRKEDEDKEKRGGGRSQEVALMIIFLKSFPLVANASALDEENFHRRLPSSAAVLPSDELGCQTGRRLLPRQAQPRAQPLERHEPLVLTADGKLSICFDLRRPSF